MITHDEARGVAEIAWCGCATTARTLQWGGRTDHEMDDTRGGNARIKLQPYDYAAPGTA